MDEERRLELDEYDQLAMFGEHPPIPDRYLPELQVRREVAAPNVGQTVLALGGPQTSPNFYQ